MTHKTYLYQKDPHIDTNHTSNGHGTDIQSEAVGHRDFPHLKIMLSEELSERWH